MSATKQSKSVRSTTRRGGKLDPAMIAVKPAPKAAKLASFDSMPINEVWKEYKASQDDKPRFERVRNYLMEKFLHLVRYNAERIYTRLPDEVDIDDLIQAGTLGLKDAIDGFELDRGVKFETFCAPRIRGAILDELRSMDWVPRLVRHRSAKVEAAKNRFSMKNGRPPNQAELAEFMSLSAEEFEKVLRDGHAVGTHSITRKATSSDGAKETRELDVAREDDDTAPLREMQRRDLKEMITKGLSRAERLIVILYYYEGMTMKEIGSTLDLSESRVSQMHSSILLRLKAQMHHREPELEPMAV